MVVQYITIAPVLEVLLVRLGRLNLGSLLHEQQYVLPNCYRNSRPDAGRPR